MAGTSSNTVPALAIEGLTTRFATRGGTVTPVDGVSLSILPGQILGLVGESGSGKSLTGYSIMGLIDPPGRIESGSIRLGGRELFGLPAGEMRKIRGNRIAMIFQDPMMTLNPVLRIDTQMIETVLAHQDVSREQALQLAADCPAAAWAAVEVRALAPCHDESRA
jgi:peptide/nickel transport system ATP-binding protein